MHKNSYTIAKKLIIIRLSLDYSVSLVSTKTKIHQSIIYRWIKNKVKFEQTSHKSTVRRIGAGRKVLLSKEIEDDILNWITIRNQQDLLVIYKLVRDYCISKYSFLGLNFSTGWFAGFKIRHSLSLRRVTSYSHKPKNNCKDSINVLIKGFREKIKKLDPSTVFVNMDETPVWFDNPSRYTITKKGTRHVSQRATSNEKKRITVVLACKSDGTKLPPVVILKQKYYGPIPLGMTVKYQNKAWMNTNLML